MDFFGEKRWESWFSRRIFLGNSNSRNLLWQGWVFCRYVCQTKSSLFLIPPSRLFLNLITVEREKGSIEKSDIDWEMGEERENEACGRGGGRGLVMDTLDIDMMADF